MSCQSDYLQPNRDAYVVALTDPDGKRASVEVNRIDFELNPKAALVMAYDVLKDRLKHG